MWKSGSPGVGARMSLAARFNALIFVAAILVGMTLSLSAQTTISTGSIVGIISDPQGAAVAGAKITITDKATGQVITTASTSTGTYASQALIPSKYTVRVEAPRFKTPETIITVEVGVTSSANFRLQSGAPGEVMQVQATTLQVNTEQATVQGVLNPAQIENLPLNGRNFLDLAQLEPGVQIQDGGNIDPTKNGLSSISLGSRFGRTARIEVDGVDTSDETVGTTTQNTPQSAIQEFQVQQSLLDLSTELTSSGSVNVVTKSGTNDLHGGGYYAFRKQQFDANLPGASDTPLERNQFGGNFGGALIKSKLFFFGDLERNKQDFNLPVFGGPPFQTDSTSFFAPFRETNGIGKIDYRINQNYKAFYRFSYDQNRDTSTFEPTAFQPLDNTTLVRDHVIGLDFSTGNYSHSVRGGYMKLFSHVATPATTPFEGSVPIELAIGPDPFCLNRSGVVPDVFCAGQGSVSSQSLAQSDYQANYDGSRVWGSHVVRFGFGFNHIQGGGFAGLLANGPAVNASASACTLTGGAYNLLCGALPGEAANALNYPATNVILGNGQGFETEKSAFGFPGGGLGPDNRISFYVGDSWKAAQTFTLTYGVRYVRDTGRTDSDLGPIPALAAFNNEFYTGLQDRVRNPNLNFAPQFGFAWDSSKEGKTVIRGGAGLFLENALWNNVLADRSARLQAGRFLQTLPACQNGVLQPLPFAYTGPDPCGQPIGSVVSAITTLQSDFQASAAGSSTVPNPAYIGTILQDTGPYGTGTNLLAPAYRSPRSVQMNLGIQHELRPGMVFTADYLRNISTHTLLAVDTNHVGDARFINLKAAVMAISQTLADCGVGAGDIEAAIASCPGLHPGGGGATIVDFASHPVPTGAPAGTLSYGLDSGYELCGGGPCPNAAFGGIANGTNGNPALGGNQMLFPIGRSVLSALQFSFKEDVPNPFHIVRHLNLQASYQLAKYVSQSTDSDFINSAWDYANPTKYTGPNGLDRRDQISFGGTADFPFHFHLSMIGHFYSGLPTTLTLAPTGLPGGIFVTGVNGDGQGDGYAANGSNGGLGGILPGTGVGSFGRSVNSGNINQVISKYNANNAGKPTPAGLTLLSSGLFTQNELTQLGAVMPVVNSPPIDSANNGWLRSVDANFSWTYKIKERVELKPGVGFFNVMNFANFDGPKNTLSGVLSTLGQAPIVGSVNGTSGTAGGQPPSLRLGLGSGVFGLGSPRVMEFTFKITF